jgi:hypothetical protein
VQCPVGSVDGDVADLALGDDDVDAIPDHRLVATELPPQLSDRDVSK